MNAKLNATLCSVALLTLGAASAIAAPDLLDQSFAVQPGGKLVMKVDRGSIHVTSSDSDRVQVKVVRDVRRASGGKAKEIIGQHRIEMAESGNTVTITADRPRKKLWSFNDPFNRLQVDYTISVPAKFDLQLKTAGGNIHVSDLEGTVAVNTSGGNLDLGSIRGPIDGHTSGGNIAVKAARGDVKVHTSGGDLRLGDIEGNLIASTSGGNITLDQVNGSVDAKTSGGDIRVKSATGPVRARTSGGNVSAKLNEQPKSGCELRTSGGNIELTIFDKIAADLDAHTSGGAITSDFPGEMNKQKTKLTAQLNGGGPSLVLATSGGNVTIRRP